MSTSPPPTAAAPSRYAALQLHGDATGADRFQRYVDHFASAAAQWRDRVAVSAGERRLTYGALDRLSDRYAAALAAAGCGAESVVAVCLERSPELLAALLGVMKCGAAFLPLDPDFAAERLRSLMERSGARAVVTEPAHAAAFAGAATLLAGVPPRVPGGAFRPPRGHPEGLAYVIYTSGSTGAPKGVAVGNASFYRYLRWALDHYAPDRGGTAVVHTSVAFDLTLTALFVPLLAGMRVTMVPQEEGMAGVLRILDEGTEPVSLLKMTPSHLRLLVETAGGGAGAWECGVLVLGGERLLPRHLRFWESRAPATRIYNEYGPTEATVGCCVARVSSAEAAAGGSLPIGTGAAGAALHLAGEASEAAGELLVGGRCLARGYLGAPALTALRFRPDPHVPGGRVYRTGDQVRRTEGGSLVFVGRNDRQRKIGGVRVELGEVEAALARHPGVREAAVASHPEEDGRETLLAFLAVDDPGDARIDLASLAATLRAHVHAAAVPSEFYLVRDLPLAAGGKRDDERLVRERHAFAQVRGAFLPPRNPTEDLLASLWCAVLDVDEVGIDDSFFALDGNSMKSIQFVFEARRAGLSLTTRDIFEHQTIRALAAAVRAKGTGGAPAPARSAPLSLLDPRDRARLPPEVEDAYPLAMLQAGTLLESDQRAGSGMYHNVNSYHVACPLDVDTFRRSLALLSARHPILRTAYDYVSYTRPLQLVHRACEIPLRVEDIRHLPEAEQERHVERFLGEESRSAFAWTRPPLLRFYIHVRGEGRFQLSLSKHHSILDGWSAATLIAEMVRNYFALLAGEPPPFRAPVETTYRDFVALEQEAIRSPEFRDFWRGRVGDARAELPPPWGGEPPRRDYEHSSIVTRSVPMSPELGARLQALARRAHVPLKSVLLAVHLRILAQVTGRTGVVTGVVSHGRPETEDADRAIGLFINTVPFPLTLDPRWSWVELARRVFAEERRMFPYQRYPMAQAKKDAGRERLFDSIFYYTNFHVFRGFRTSEEVRFLGSAGFEETEIPLTVAFSLHPLWASVSLAIHFHVDRFSAAQVENVVEYARQALASIDEEPEAPALARHLATDAERLALHAGPTVRDPAGTAFALFRERAAAHPDAAALATERGRVSYGALLRRSESLAARLVRSGAGPERVVAISLARPSEAIAAMLAAHRAGAAFAVLDGTLPDRRVDEMVRALDPVAVVADGESADRFRARGVEVVELPAEDAPPPSLPPTAAVGGDSLAYVVFTSGSTGRPKGVMVSHGALYRSTRARLRFYPEPYRHFLLLSRLTFDSAFAGIWGTLCGGGTLHLLDDGDASDAAAAASRIRDAGITHFLAIPSLHRVLLPELAPAGKSALHTVIVAGEEVPAEVVRAHRERLPGVPLVNEYGPTEGTVWATAAEVAGEEDGGIPIGGPLGHVTTAVLGEDGSPASLGAAGELYIGGEALARGYLGDPRTTARRFVPDPWAVAGRDPRLYRTGDRVRTHPDGRLRFAGRADHQLKVRGFRIEPEEVERAFQDAFPGREALVGAWEDAPGRRRLFLCHAAVDGAAAATPAPAEVRDRLASHLPRHALPDTAFAVEALPRLPNGKLDRTHPPRPPAEGSEAGAPAPRPPITEVERAIAGLWGEALGVPQAEADRSFFDGGGDSLLANQVVLRIQRIFGLRLPLQEFYRAPTIATQARLLGERGEEAGVDLERIAAIWNSME